jgi:tetratricopeptide (TPR) repeat protein
MPTVLKSIVRSRIVAVLALLPVMLAPACKHEKDKVNCTQGDNKCFVEGYSNRIEQDPKDADAYYHRCLALDALKQFEKAIDDCSKAVEFNPGFVKAYGYRGFVYSEVSRYKDAIADDSKVIELDPTNVDGYRILLRYW